MPVTPRHRRSNIPRVQRGSVLLPLFPQMTSQEQDRVLGALFGECSQLPNTAAAQRSER